MGIFIPDRKSNEPLNFSSEKYSPSMHRSLNATERRRRGPKSTSTRGRRRGPKSNSTRGRRREPPKPNWLELPAGVMTNILNQVGAIDILENVQKVCTGWRSICKDPSMWRVIDMYNLGDLGDMPYDLEKMCRHAVDRSQGQLVDINIEYFGTDDLVEYIAERSSQLRCLRIFGCYDLSEGLNKAFKNLPLLEELHLILTTISEEGIETLGRCCPLLRSLTLNGMWYRSNQPLWVEDALVWDEDAIAIGKNLPELRHLQLIGNKLTNAGLQAILDGCSHLESLDLRKCFNLDLEGSLGKRCSEQIKDLKRPDDSTVDCSFITDQADLPTNPSDWDSYDPFDFVL